MSEIDEKKGHRLAVIQPANLELFAELLISAERWGRKQGYHQVRASQISPGYYAILGFKLERQGRHGRKTYRRALIDLLNDTWQKGGTLTTTQITTHILAETGISRKSMSNVYNLLGYMLGKSVRRIERGHYQPIAETHYKDYS